MPFRLNRPVGDNYTGPRAGGGKRWLLHVTAVWAAAMIGLTSVPSNLRGAVSPSRLAPLSPEQAIAAFQMEPGLDIELVAAEPLVIDPVAFAFDERGRLFVVEARGYPERTDLPSTREGRIARIDDSDGDGKYDRRTEFATGLGHPNGVTVWRGGVFVTCAPDILYLKDHDDDGVADERTVVLTGFSTSKTTQLRVSHPTMGFDGKIYVAGGRNGGNVISPLHPDRPPVAFNASDGRFDPDSFEFESIGGNAQFGLTFDAFGRRFICSNRDPIMHVVIAPSYLTRNPHLGMSAAVQNVSEVQGDAKVYPISRPRLTADFIPALMGKPHTGTFTSACGLFVFGGTGMAREHVGNAFICEPAQNLVQRQIIRPAGASFRSHLPYIDREFLSSTDPWFRPVFVGSGPDGALHIADMHRREIDHPEYVPKESRGSFDFTSGKGSGRIYRVVRRDGAEPVALRRVRYSDLDTGDDWTRTTAHRLLLETFESGTVAWLENIAREAPDGPSRARAMYVLAGREMMSEALLQDKLFDPDPGVREHAALLCGSMPTPRGELLAALLKGARDSDPRVRFAVALTLGGIEDELAIDGLVAVAAADGGHRWTRAAVFSSIGGRAEKFMEAFNKARPADVERLSKVREGLGRLLGSGASTDACRAFVEQILREPADVGVKIPPILGLADGLRTRPPSKGAKAPIGSLAGLYGIDSLPEDLTRLFRAAARLAKDPAAPLSQRLSAAALLGHAEFPTSGPALAALVDNRHPPEVQLQAVRALENIGDARGGDILLDSAKWKRYTPQVREAVIATLTSRPELINGLLAALERGTIQAAEIPSFRRIQLTKHAVEEIRTRADAAFKNIESGDRMQVYRANRDVLQLTGNPSAGRPVFIRSCSACHTYSGFGGKVGPDLTGVRNQPADALLLHILVPNYEVSPGYHAVTVTTRNGGTISGWIVAEGEHAITIRTAFDTEESVPRSTISLLAGSGLSLMPDGLELGMSKQEMADLIAYLKDDQ